MGILAESSPFRSRLRQGTRNWLVNRKFEESKLLEKGKPLK